MNFSFRLTLCHEHLIRGNLFLEETSSQIENFGKFSFFLICLQICARYITLQKQCTDLEGPMSKYTLKSPIDGAYFGHFSFFFFKGGGGTWGAERFS